MGLPREFPYTFVPGPRLYFSPKQLLETPRWLPKARGGLCHLTSASFPQGSPAGPLPAEPCSRALVLHLEVQGLLWEVSDPSIRSPCFLRAPRRPRPAGEPRGSSFCGPTGRARLTSFTLRWCGAEADAALQQEAWVQDCSPSCS